MSTSPGVDGGSVDSVENYVYNDDDELRCKDGISYEYDLNGNLTKKIDPVAGTTEYSWNFLNRLIQASFPNDTECKYHYNHDGLRLWKRDRTGRTTYYFWDPRGIGEALNHSDEEGNVTLILSPGLGFKSIRNTDDPDKGSTLDNASWRFFITDHLGSVKSAILFRTFFASAG